MIISLLLIPNNTINGKESNNVNKPVAMILNSDGEKKDAINETTE